MPNSSEYNKQYYLKNKENKEKVHCLYCQKTYNPFFFNRHINSSKHIINKKLYELELNNIK